MLTDLKVTSSAAAFWLCVIAGVVFYLFGCFEIESARATEDLLLAHTLTMIVVVGTAAYRSTVRGSRIWLDVLLFVFIVGYLAKSFIALSSIDALGSLEVLNPEWIVIDRSQVIDGLLISCAHINLACFVAFALDRIALFHPPAGSTYETPAYPLFDAAPSIQVLLTATFAFAAILLALRWQLDIGKMGVETDPLPLRLDTLIFRTQSAILPAVFIFLVYFGMATGRTAVRNFAALGFLTHEFALSYISLSKSGVIFAVIALIFLWQSTGRITARGAALIVIAGVISVFLYQFGWILRLAEISGELETLGVSQILMQTITSISEAPAKILTAIGLRVTGVDGIWFASEEIRQNELAHRLAQIQNIGLVEYYSRDVRNITWLADFREPGLIGAFMLVAGLDASFLLMAMFVGACGYAFLVLEKQPGNAALQANGSLYLLKLSIGGTFALGDFISCVLGILTITVLARLYLRTASAVT